MARRKLQGCRAVITGASSGIGQALALELARRGARTLLVARSAERLANVQQTTGKLGCKAVVLAGDVTDPAVREAVVATAHDELGGLDLLVNNAGVSAQGPFREESPEVLRQIFEVNFFAITELTRLALPLLSAGERPLIVNVGSILGSRAIPFNSSYCASKFALAGWSESLRAELAGQGIDLLLVVPGSTRTKFHDHLLEKHLDLPWAKSGFGVPPEYVARKTAAAMERGRRQIVPNWAGWWMLLGNRLAPRLMDSIMARLARQMDKSS